MKKCFLVIVILCLAVCCLFDGSAVFCAGQEDTALRIEKLKKDIKETELNIKALKERYSGLLKKKERIKKEIMEEEAKIQVLKKKKQDRLSREREKTMDQCLRELNLSYKKR